MIPMPSVMSERLAKLSSQEQVVVQSMWDRFNDDGRKKLIAMYERAQNGVMNYPEPKAQLTKLLDEQLEFFESPAPHRAY